MNINCRVILLAILCTTTAFVVTWAAPAAQTAATEQILAPSIDHHQHLRSPAVDKLWNQAPVSAVTVPEKFKQLLRKREEAWHDKSALLNLYTPNAVALDLGGHWIRGRADVAKMESERFARSYRITPISYSMNGTGGTLAGYFTRGEGPAAAHFGHVLLSLTKDSSGAWHIAGESDTFPGPTVMEPLDAKKLITLLDEAGIHKAVVLSLAYAFGSPLNGPVTDEYAKVKAENDWTAQQAALYPDRLVAFCSFNPLKQYALTELTRCATHGLFKGLKLHFGNSNVDLKNPEHLKKVQDVFRAANRLHMPIVVHLWTLDPTYGKQDAEIFLNDVVSVAPDIPIQIAHMAGGGPGWTDPALAVYAEAIAAGDPRTKNLYFDIATVADKQTYEMEKQLAMRIRQIGVHRILYGSDAAFGGRNTPREEWGVFRGMVPLTDEEFRVVAHNVAPYMK